MRSFVRAAFAVALVGALVAPQPAVAGPSDRPQPAAAGLPQHIPGDSALSAAIMTTIGGRNSPFDEVTLMADWDGKEDLTADRGAKVTDFSFADIDIDMTRTRVAMSAHTRGNGFQETISYIGDSVGNVWVAADTAGEPLAEELFQINLPSVMGAFGELVGDDQVTITGLCVNPVADLTSFFKVNSDFTSFDGRTGEILYVTFHDPGGGLRFTSGGRIARSGLLAFPVADETSTAADPPGVISDTGFPVTVGGPFGVAFSKFGNVAGCAVDDDGSVYFQQVDLIQFTGANIVKVASQDIATNQDRSLATSGFLTISTLSPANGDYGTASGPTSQVSRYTNYSGTSAAFGNVMALAAGPGNTLYAALAASRDSGLAAAGPFANPSALGKTPSMVVSFADYRPPGSGGLPRADGRADVAVPGQALNPGVNNFRAFVLGNGPDRRGTLPAFGTKTNTLKLDLQVDPTIFAGLTVDEFRTTYVVSGGTPAGEGDNPSPRRGEILAFEDRAPADRRGDSTDFRGNTPPDPPFSGGNAGDGDSDRFDHLFWVAPTDPVNLTPAGVAGLADGFLRYLNRTADTPVANLPNGTTQQDNESSGPIVFEHFDPGHAVAGGDDQSPYSTGDDADGTGEPPLAGPREGGFELSFAGDFGAQCKTPWNAFFLGSNGFVSFGGPVTDGTPTKAEFHTGRPRIAPAWANLNPGSRTSFPGTFPVQAVGFAAPNAFAARWINVPLRGAEADGNSNTLSLTLLDDGTGPDENAPGEAEGPTDLRFRQQGGQLVGSRPRPAGSGRFAFEYGRVDLEDQVIAGYSIGSQPASPSPETDLSEVGRTAIVGNGSQKVILELFTADDHDLRSEGSHTAIATPAGQPDDNREFLLFAGRTAC